jgi:rhodanese-related sulfurtransferase
MSVKNIAAQQLKELLTQDPKPFLLDVREPFELTAFGAVPGVVNIPMDDVPGRLNELPEDRSIPIVVVCQSGARSSEVSAFLVRNGFTAVHNLQGGTYSWLRSQRA